MEHRAERRRSRSRSRDRDDRRVPKRWDDDRDLDYGRRAAEGDSRRRDDERYGAPARGQPRGGRYDSDGEDDRRGRRDTGSSPRRRVSPPPPAATSSRPGPAIAAAAVPISPPRRSGGGSRWGSDEVAVAPRATAAAAAADSDYGRPVASAGASAAMSGAGVAASSASGGAAAASRSGSAVSSVSGVASVGASGGGGGASRYDDPRDACLRPPPRSPEGPPPPDRGAAGGGGRGRWGGDEAREEEDASGSSGAAAAPPPPGKEPEKADFGLSGALAQDKAAGTVYKGVTLKWSEPPEARTPSRRWRAYIFKNGAEVEAPLHLHKSSAFLFGRERKVADVPVDHPSCSSQHAVLQYRQVTLPVDPGSLAPPQRVVKPYIMDLESTNGTFLNGRRIEGGRYYELKSGDVLRFGLSTREYVLLPEDAAA